MSIESIIGITASLFGIISGVIATTKWYNNRFCIDNQTRDLFNQIMDKKTTDAERQKILKKINRAKVINGRISDDFIQRFSLSGRGKESVLLDICKVNHIEPTDDVCKSLLGSAMPSLMAKYKADDMPIKHEEPSNQLIAPNSKQTVYLSALLKEKFPTACNDLTTLLDKHHIDYAFLEGTKDVWCRDYMPIQTPSGKLIQFRYEPSYLKGDEWEELRTDVREVCRVNHINAQFSNINLDGGNVLLCDGRAIISDRIFSENPDRDKENLVAELAELLESEVIIIPSENEDMTGHADGMVRFVNRNTILGNDMEKEYQYWRKGMQKVIAKYNLKYINVPFVEIKDPKHKDNALGIYVNYLELDNLIILPIFGIKEDELAIKILKETFPTKVVETIDYNEVALEGGLLNCTTWVRR